MWRISASSRLADIPYMALLNDPRHTPGFSLRFRLTAYRLKRYGDGEDDVSNSVWSSPTS
jgi:hypothetical protein